MKWYLAPLRMRLSCDIRVHGPWVCINGHSCPIHCTSMQGLTGHHNGLWVLCQHYDDVIMTMLASQITSLTVVYSIVYSGVNQRKHQSSALLAIVREIHRGPVNFPHKWPVTRKMFPFDDVIMKEPRHERLRNVINDNVNNNVYLKNDLIQKHLKRWNTLISEKVMAWVHFSLYWSFVRGCPGNPPHQLPVVSQHKGSVMLSFDGFFFVGPNIF